MLPLLETRTPEVLWSIIIMHGGAKQRGMYSAIIVYKNCYKNESRAKRQFGLAIIDNKPGGLDGLRGLGKI
jgi:hypothetical protein